MRYLKITLIIGLAVSIVVAVFYEAGAFRHLDAGLSDFLERPTDATPRHPVMQFFLFILLAFGVAWTTVDINRPPLKVVVAAGALLQVLLLPVVLNFYHGFFSPFPSALAVMLSFGAAFAYSRSDAGKRKRMLRSVFGLRLSKKTFTALVDANTPLNFQGELREATIVVCEIFNHDVLAEMLDDLPPFTDYSMANRTYRYFTGKPLFAFGHGLSYTQFKYGPAQLDHPHAGLDDTVHVTLDVTNSGARDGDEVVQVYYRHVKSAVPQPLEALCGFQRVTIASHQSARVDIPVLVKGLRYWDVARKQYTVEQGDYEILVAAASDDIRARLPLHLGAP